MKKRVVFEVNYSTAEELEAALRAIIKQRDEVMEQIEEADLSDGAALVGGGLPGFPPGGWTWTAFHPIVLDIACNEKGCEGFPLFCEKHPPSVVEAKA